MDALLSSIPHHSQPISSTASVPPIIFLCAACSTPITSSASLISYHPGITSLLFSHALTQSRKDTAPVLPPASASDAFCPYLPLYCRCSAVLGRRYVATTPKLPELLERCCLSIETLSIFRLGQEQDAQSRRSANDDSDTFEPLPVVTDPSVMRYLHPEPEVIPEWIGKVMGVMVVMKEELDQMRSELEEMKEAEQRREEERTGRNNSGDGTRRGAARKPATALDMDVDKDGEEEGDNELYEGHQRQLQHEQGGGNALNPGASKVIPDSQGSEAGHTVSPSFVAETGRRSQRKTDDMSPGTESSALRPHRKPPAASSRQQRSKSKQPPGTAAAITLSSSSPAPSSDHDVSAPATEPPKRVDAVVRQHPHARKGIFQQQQQQQRRQGKESQPQPQATRTLERPQHRRKSALRRRGASPLSESESERRGDDDDKISDYEDGQEDGDEKGSSGKSKKRKAAEVLVVASSLPEKRRVSTRRSGGGAGGF